MSAALVHRGADPAAATVTCILVHGRTQSPQVMEEHVLARLPPMPKVSFLLPAAEGNAWYDAKAVDPLTERTRAQLDAACAVLKEAFAMAGPGKPVLLAGFSQGACLSIEFALRNGRWNGALAALTGCRVGAQGDDRPRADLAGLPVYLTGSDADPWIPAQSFGIAAGELALARARLRCDILPGRSHEVSAAEIANLGAMLLQLENQGSINW